MGDVTPPLLEGWLAVCGLKREGAVWGGRAVIGGGRTDLLAHRLEAAIAAERPAGLISFGVAGALMPELRIGEAVVGSAVCTIERERFACDDPTTRQLAATVVARVGEVFGVDRLMFDLAAKQGAATRGMIVDMESHVAARVAAAHGLRLAILRVVSDEAGHALPPAAQVAMRADGGVDVPAILRSLVGEPRQIVALLRTGLHASRAFRRLAEVREALR